VLAHCKERVVEITNGHVVEVESNRSHQLSHRRVLGARCGSSPSPTIRPCRQVSATCSRSVGIMSRLAPIASSSCSTFGAIRPDLPKAERYVG
jgi:hypothetical protein